MNDTETVPCISGSVALEEGRVRHVLIITFRTDIPFDAENRDPIMPTPHGLFAKITCVGLVDRYDIDNEKAETRKGKIDKCAFTRIHSQISPESHRRFLLALIT